MKTWRKLLVLMISFAMMVQLGGALTLSAATITDDDVNLVAKTAMIANSTYFEGLYEPIAGIYFGASYEQDTNISTKGDFSKYYIDYVNDFYPKKNSAYLMHLDFGTPIETIQSAVDEADEAKVGIVLVWKTEEVYSDIKVYEDYIEETAEYLRWLDVPVFLSYGSGMNAVLTSGDAASFVKDFQFVAGKVRDTASDIAIVWTVDDGNPNSIDAFYPGDAYVDWIGINTYIKPGEESFSGIDTVIKKYGNYKPVMLTEVGVARYSSNTGEKLTDWAEEQIRKIYSYLPMQYPQIKGIFYGNGYYDRDRWHSYDVYGDDDIMDVYNEVVSNGIFMKDIKQSDDYRYAVIDSRPDRSVFVEDSFVELSTYIDETDLSNIKVEYVVDGRVLMSPTDVPYIYKLSIKGMSEEKHALKLRVYEDKTLLSEQLFTIIKTEDGALIESGTFDVIHFEDIRHHWSESYIIEVSKRGLVVGSNGVFRPDDLISRAEMTSVITKLGKLPQSAPVTFKDVPTSKWYHKYVGSTQKYLTGYGNYYYPERYATREEIITALVKLKGLNLSDITSKDRTSFAEDYVDDWKIKAENKDYMILAVKYGIVGGYEDGTLRPQNNMKRGEVAKVLYTAFYQ